MLVPASAVDPPSLTSAISQRKPLEVGGSPKNPVASSVEDYGWGMVPASWLYGCEVSPLTSATNCRPLLKAAGSTKSQAGSVIRVTAPTSATNCRPLLKAAGSTKSQAGSLKRV
ncbi:unnamed protein product [Pleuronectes platessa]|uniref:Uncharacterized protein n=1 Tax=Pleuronectes platessa TaxID=8262 RepID=A0A9N7UCY2_PLEPL|nr:unnamed protein product [Pleuronectes platessa]